MIENIKNTSSNKPTEPNPPPPAPGLRGLKATAAFRALNFELFVRPNKVVMGLGLAAITGCVAYIAYLNAVTENKTVGVYEVYDVEGSVQTTQRKKSKWD
ncbi:unnamed protein product [Clavelina lepadiformis]|uniref:Small integral membrane protein 8 n=1 Tax=Clavelina lepadiformis TaxID=159417 RepID=A0ABP0G4V4_CLALP